MGWLRRMRRVATWLRTQQGLLAVTLSIAMVVLVATWFHIHGQAERAAAAAASRVAAVVARDTAQEIESLDLTLQTVVGGRQSAADTQLSLQERSALLSERAPPSRYVDFVEVLGADGNVLASTRAGPELGNWSTRDYFVKQRAARASDPLIGEPYSILRDQKAAVTVSRRLPDRNGQFAGVVVLGLRLAYFRDLFDALELGPRDTVALVTTTGTLLMQLPFDPGDIGRQADGAAAFRAFTRTGASALALRDPPDDVLRSFALRRAGSLPLVVSVGITVEHQALWWLPALAAMFAAVIALVARWWWREAHRRRVAEGESHEKSRFLTTLSHELRTPLHAVLGNAEMVGKSALAPDEARAVTEIVRAARHMRDVVNVVLDYARVESRGPTLQMRNVDVQRLLDDCIAFVEPEATKRRLVMRVVMAPGAPIHFVTDELQLRQILMNLLGNSVKYTPQGSIELRVSGDESDLRIEVADTGIGIPEGRRHLLFREYERFGTEKTGIEGTGLGLAIAHRLARRLGGHLGHRDNPVGGSVFWLEIPAGAPAVEDVAAAASIAETATALRVLLVDDSVVNREIAAGYLRKSGHTVIEASDGSDAVELAGAHDFDVVLMDMRMSGMNGLEATRRIRALPAPRGKVPIVAVTANALDEHAEECRRAGMNDHLAKPFAQADLLAVVVRAAARRRVFDTAGLAQVASAIGEEEAERLLDCLGLRIEALLRRLDDPTKVPSREELADLAHELAGSGGTLGFQRLASAARRYAVAVRSGAADGRDLAGEAKNVLTALQRRRSLETLLSV